MEKNDYEQNVLIHNSNSNNIEEKNDNSLKDIEEEFKCINDEINDLNNNNDINDENLDIKNTSNAKDEIKIDDSEDKNIIIDDEIKNEINQKEKENSIIFSPREINDKNDNLNIPDNTKFGIDKSQIKDIVKLATTGGRMDNNPIVFDEEEIEDILKSVY